MTFVLLCPSLCCRLGQVVQCERGEGCTGTQREGKGDPLVPGAVVPCWCPRREKREDAVSLSRCCSLFVPLTLAAVVLVLVRGEGLAAAQTGALSLSTAQVPCEALGVAGSES